MEFLYFLESIRVPGLNEFMLAVTMLGPIPVARPMSVPSNSNVSIAPISEAKTLPL